MDCKESLIVTKATHLAEELSARITKSPVVGEFDFSRGPVTVKADLITYSIQFPGITTPNLHFDPGWMMLGLVSAERDNLTGLTLIGYPHIRTGECIGQTAILVDTLTFNRIWDKCVSLLS